jgi:post-segregation antitoxin (ccd killing protein)
MNTMHATSQATPKRRTTLTLPSDSLAAAERIARARKVNLSTVIAEVINEGLRARLATERSGQVLKSYRQAFSRFTDAEMLLLDGVVMDERADR